MPRELKGVNVDFISLVSKGANKQQLMLYKSADPVPQQTQETKVEPNETMLEKVMKAVKSVFVQKEDNKISFDEFMKREMSYSNLWSSFDVMRDVMYDILYWSSSDTPKADLETELEAFKQFVLKTVSDLGVTKSLEIMKSDKQKVVALTKSADTLDKQTLAKFESSLNELGSIFNTIKSGESVPKEEEEVKTEEVVKAIQDAMAPITKSIEEVKTQVDSITTKVDGLEKGAGEVKEQVQQTATQTEEVKQEVEKTAEDLIKAALEPLTKSLGDIATSVNAVSQRVEKMESLRVPSNGASDGAPAGNTTTVTKSDKTDFSNVLKFN